ncbi:MAG: extracellular solute-binding protein [Ruminiclostridium sp.]|nr:extracellular solute-binding protein [Ruminiclostridium sp.]
MKFKIIIILSLLLILCSCSKDKATDINNTVNEEMDDVGILSDLHTYDLFDIAVDNDENNIYIADKEHILITDRDGNKKSEIKGLQFCTKLALGDNGIYALDRRESGNVIKEFSSEGKLNQEIQIDTGGNNVLKIEYSNGKLIFLQYNKETEKNTISILNLENKVMKHVDIENIDVFTVYNDNTLIIGDFKSFQRKFVIYEYEKNEIIEEIESINASRCTDLVYDNRDSSLYYTEDCRIYKYNLKNNEAEKLIDLRNHTDFMFPKIVSTANTFYLLDTQYDRIFCIGKEAVNTKAKNALTIVSRNSVEHYLEKAEELFKRRNPQCDVAYKTKGNEGLKISIMSGDKDIDIIYVENHLYNDFIGCGAVIPLDGYQNVKENFTFMFDGIEDLCKYDNKLVGVPVHLGIYAWEANPVLLEKLNLELPEEDWNWNDFYEYAKLARKDINGDGRYDTYVIEGQARYPTFLQQYCSMYMDLSAGKASFNNDEFKSLLSLWKKMWNEDLIASGTFNNTKMKDNILFNLKNCSLKLGDAMIIYPPALPDGQKSYPSQVYLLSINSFSQNKDLAAELLSIYYSKEAQAAIELTTGRTYYKDISVYPPISSGKDKLSNDRNLEVFRNMFLHSEREQDHLDLRGYMLDTISEYMSDRITLDTAAKLIDDKAKMIVGE